MSQRKQPNDSTAAYAGLISQIGCATSLASVIIIALAFGAGRLLDSTFGTNGIFTVILLVGSFPVTLYVTMRLALSTAARARVLTTDKEDDENQEHEEVADT